MAHVLILGMTESGKTTLARNLAARYKRAGLGVLVLDPLSDPRWQCDFITADQEEFLQVFWSSRSCVAFLDEGGESVGRYDLAMQKTATRGRHWGHSCHYIAQRATQLAPIVRDMCTHLFLFCSSAKDGKLLAEEFNKPELELCNTYAQGQYVHAVKFGKTTASNVRGDDNGADTRRGGSSSDNPRISSEPKKGQSEAGDKTGSEAGSQDGSEAGGPGE
jgi:hypothetical protein